MITAILPYVGSYSDIRAASGLNSKELPDAELQLDLYWQNLGYALDSVSGIYAPSVVDQTLQEMFDTLAAGDPMKVAIQQYSVCVVANTAVGPIGLKAAKVITDGKASLTRFSSESTFKEASASTQACRSSWLTAIKALLGVTASNSSPSMLTVAKPAYDPVTGA